MPMSAAIGGELNRSGLAGELATPRHRRVFGVIAGLLGLIGVFTYLHADTPLAPLPAFLPTYASAVIVTDLITAYLVLAHASLAGNRHLLWIGAAYLYSGSIVIGQMLVFPGVWSEKGFFGAGPQSAVWIWVIWHGGFPAFVLPAMVVMLRQGSAKVTVPVRHALIAGLAALLLVTGTLVLVTAGHDWLPPLIVAGDYHTLSASPAAHLVQLLNITALLSVLVVKRGRTVFALGLSLALFASLLDAVLTLHAGTRFSLGWYVARMTSVVAAFSVLAVYLREATWLYARVIKLNAHLEEKASVDVLTGLFNRRYFDQQLVSAFRNAQRRREPMSLLMLDVDHFKLYNDHYGHVGGDQCLQAVAAAIATAVKRPTDVATRYGGEEFAIILPATNAAGARDTANRILGVVAELRREHKASPTAPHVTVSIGMATTTLESGEQPADLVRAADAALYRAKSAGRNRAL